MTTPNGCRGNWTGNSMRMGFPFVLGTVGRDRSSISRWSEGDDETVARDANKEVMIMPLSPVIASLLEKAAVDNGLDQELRYLLGEDETVDWIGFASTQCPLRIWLGVLQDATFVVAFSQQSVARSLSAF